MRLLLATSNPLPPQCGTSCPSSITKIPREEKGKYWIKFSLKRRKKQHPSKTFIFILVSRAFVELKQYQFDHFY